MYLHCWLPIDSFFYLRIWRVEYNICILVKNIISVDNCLYWNWTDTCKGSVYISSVSKKRNTFHWRYEPYNPSTHTLVLYCSKYQKLLFKVKLTKMYKLITKVTLHMYLRPIVLKFWWVIFDRFYDKSCSRFQLSKLDDWCQFVFFDAYNRANYTPVLTCCVRYHCRQCT